VASHRPSVIGWDIGGVHVKAVRLPGQNLEAAHAVTRPFEIWRERERLPAVLREVMEELGSDGIEAMAVTMTAELSDAFRSKREGVLFVLEALEQAFPQMPIHLLGLSGEFVSLGEARQHPLLFAAANWLASALLVATRYPDCILMDMGSTTTDIIPIRDGQVISDGLTDVSRLASGELVYTGVVRTNPNTVTSQVPVGGYLCRVSAEYFCVMGDVYLLLGRLSPDEYTGSTPDGRGRSRQEARERLARLVCADAEMLSEEEILKLAYYLYEKQMQLVSESLLQVLSRLEGGLRLPLVVAGVGGFLAAEVGRRLGMQVMDLGEVWGERAVAVLPSLAVAYLLAGRLDVRGND